MMCDDRLFATQITRLCHEFEDKVEVIVPVLDTADTIEGLAHNIIAEAPASFALAGLSMGGIVAMEILAKAPERINRLALMDTNPLAETTMLSSCADSCALATEAVTLSAMALARAVRVKRGMAIP